MQDAKQPFWREVWIQVTAGLIVTAVAAWRWQNIKPYLATAGALITAARSAVAYYLAGSVHVRRWLLLPLVTRSPSGPPAPKPRVRPTWLGDSPSCRTPAPPAAAIGSSNPPDRRTGSPNSGCQVIFARPERFELPTLRFEVPRPTYSLYTRSYSIVPNTLAFESF